MTSCGEKELEQLQELFLRVKKSLDCDSLDYKWEIRNFLFERAKEVGKQQKLQTRIGKQQTQIAQNIPCNFTSKHKLHGIDKNTLQFLIKLVMTYPTYLKKNKEKIKKDKSLKTLTILCTKKSKVDATKQATAFNKIFGKGRKVFRCYDCGTMARVAFLELVNKYRNRIHNKSLSMQHYKSLFAPEEITSISSSYDSDNTNVLHNVSGFMEDLQKDAHQLFICSIGFDEEFGHIFLIEKIPMHTNKILPNKIIQNKYLYRIYQSAKNAYTLFDFLEYADYTKQKGIDIIKFCKTLKTLLLTNNYTEQQFIDLFKFIPPSPINVEHKSFIYGVLSI